MIRTVRRTLYWLAGILLAATIFAGIGVYQLWSRSDELLHQAFVNAMQAWAPELQVKLEGVRLDWIGRVRVEQFSLQIPDDDQPLIDLPDVVVDLDREAFLYRQQIVVQNVQMTGARVEVHRTKDGQWNFQKLPPLPPSKRSSLPTVELVNAELVVHIDHPDGVTHGTVILDRANIRLTPNGRRSVLVEGRTNAERIGELSFEGRLNADTLTGSLTGRLAGIQVDRDLLTLASNFEPTVIDRVAQVEQKLLAEMLKEPDPAAKSPFSIAGIGRNQNIQQATLSDGSPPRFVNVSAGGADSNGLAGAFPHRIPAVMLGGEESILGLQAQLDVSFRVAVPHKGATPELRLLVDVADGAVTNTALPFPLEGLSGQIECSDQQLTVHRLTAKNGPTSIHISGTVSKTDAGPTGKIGLEIKNLACDQRLRDRLSDGFGKIYDTHHPQGFLDMAISVASTPDGEWKPGGLVVTSKRCSVIHDLFPYPIHNAVGTIRQNGRDLDIDVLGYAGARPISLKGFVKNPGPEAWMLFEIEVADVPIDTTFYQACPPAMQKVLDSMNLGGVVSANWKLERPPGPDQKVVPSLDGRLYQGRMAFESFPYQVDQITGRLTFDGTTWNFTELVGRHGQATLNADGSFTKVNGRGRTLLTITTSDAAIDQSLVKALPDNLQAVQKQFDLGGTIKRCVTSVEIIEGEPARITLPEIDLANCRMRPTMFPYEVSGFSAKCRFADGWLMVDEFAGRHGRTLLAANGFVQTQPNGDWRARFEKWTARSLLPDASFLQALSPGLRKVFSALDPRTPVTAGGMLDLRGTTDPAYPAMTAAWDVALDLDGSDVTMGMEFRDVRGRIYSAGRYDGRHVHMERGTLELDQATVLEKYRLNSVRGPIRVVNDTFIAGSGEVFTGRTSSQPIDPSEQITAEFIGGRMAMNAAVPLMTDDNYKLRVTLTEGRLESFARQYMTSRDKLQGVMNGWVDMTGRGDDTRSLRGVGRLQINPASLYEMPVVFQVLKAITLSPQDNSAFEYARVGFQIANQQFYFTNIDLVGPSLQLRGEGTADFNGNLNLAFISLLVNAPPKSQFWIPGVSELAGIVGGVTNGVSNLVGVAVEVTGTTENPQTRIIPASNIDNALKGLIRGLGPLPLQVPTPPAIPGLARPNGSPRSF